jgi:hypothetical protein
MARTPNTPTELMDDVELIPGISDAQNQLSAMQAAHSNERDLVNQLLGQAQMADAFTKFSKTVFISKLVYVKENKLYRAIAGKPTEDGLQLAGTWEEFCKLLDWTPQHANEAIASFKAFGEEALESMSNMGIGYRQMRQFRKLPEDERVALIEVAKAGDQESFVELAEEIIAKSTREKDALKKELDETRADYEAQGEVLHSVQNKLTETRLDAERTKRRIQAASPQEAGDDLCKEAGGHFAEALSVIQTRLLPAIEALMAHTDDTGIDHSQYLGKQLSLLDSALIAIRDTHQLPTADEMAELDWMNPDNIDAINAQVEQLKGH